MSHQLENSEQVLSSHHPADRCLGETCTIHNMSDHPLRALEQHWNGEFMERISPSGEVWEDPDSPYPQDRPNAARCLDCGVVLYSRFRHDYKECACPNLMVDGGSAYIRRGWRKGESSIEEIKSWPVPAGWQ
jgi:hypothetical protein